MTVYEAMERLEMLGYSFRLTDSGEVKFRSPSQRTPEACSLLEIVRSDRKAAADYVRQRDYSVLDALAISQAVKRGDAVLLAPVVFHREPLTVTVLWQPVQGVAEAVLAWHRERLETALCRRLAKMEDETFDGWTDAEIDRFCEKYAYMKWLMEGCS